MSMANIEIIQYNEFRKDKTRECISDLSLYGERIRIVRRHEKLKGQKF